jgi:hypothetical protein
MHFPLAINEAVPLGISFFVNWAVEGKWAAMMFVHQ